MGNVTMIPLKDMKVDYTYQREPDKKRIAKIANNWNDLKANLLHVSERPDGYYVMDGNHTRLAYESLDGAEMLCRVYKGLTVKEEARIFTELNTSQKKPTFLEIFKAKIEAGDTSAISYVEALNEANIEFSLTGCGTHNECVIRCHNNLFRIHNKTTKALFIRALNAARRAANGRKEFYQVGYFTGLCDLVITHPNIDDNRLINGVRKMTSSQILEIAEKYKRGIVSGSNSSTANFRKAYTEVYNKGLKKNRIEE